MDRIAKSGLLLLLLLTTSGTLFAQKVLTGSIFDEEGKSIKAASIYLTPLNSDLILNFGSSGQDGRYEVALPSGHDSLMLNISHIGYKSIQKAIPNQAADLSFKMVPGVVALKEVTIKQPKLISFNKDTVSYQVDIIKDDDDRVIRDVLEKLPGIRVSENGMISYQGRPIQKFYIEGLDLLEGRYNLANQNLPAGSVESVEILLNHQPVKMMDSIAFTDRTSMNLRLKKNTTFTGQVQAGAGGLPFLRDINATAMLFTGKQQAIGTYQSNNTGKDISKQTKNLYIADLFRELKRESMTNSWLQVMGPGSPPFSEERWLRNNARLGSVNYLLKLSGKLEAKINASYYHNFNHETGARYTNFYLVDDTVGIAENSRNRIHQQFFEGGLVLEKNSRKNYFKNKLDYRQSRDVSNGSLVTGEAGLEQVLLNPYQYLSNTLDYLLPVKNNILAVHSNFHYLTNAQTLHIKPGLLQQHDDSLFSRENMQFLNFKNIFTDNFIAASKKKGSFLFKTRLGFAFERQHLQTVLQQGGQELLSTDSLKNDISLQQFRAYSQWGVQLKRAAWLVDLKLPLALNFFEITDLASIGIKSSRVPTIEPELRISYQFNSRWTAGLTTSYKNKFGEVDRLYSGYILRSYRNLEANTNELLHIKNTSITTRLEYSDLVRSLFANAHYSYQVGARNLLYSSKVTGGGAVTRTAVAIPNFSYSHNYRLELSKYVNWIRSTFRLEGNVSYYQNEQLLNELKVGSDNLVFNISPRVNTKIIDWLRINYEADFSYFSNFIKSDRYSNFRNYRHLVAATLYPAKEHLIKLEGETFTSDFSQKSAAGIFLNLGYYYTWTRHNIEASGQLMNIFDATNYQTVMMDSFYVMENNYLLRPRQLLVSVRFSF